MYVAPCGDSGDDDDDDDDGGGGGGGDDHDEVDDVELDVISSCLGKTFRRIYREQQASQWFKGSNSLPTV